MNVLCSEICEHAKLAHREFHVSLYALFKYNFKGFSDSSHIFKHTLNEYLTDLDIAGERVSSGCYRHFYAFLHILSILGRQQTHSWRYFALPSV